MTVIVTGMYLFAGFRDALVELEKNQPDAAEAVKSRMGGGEIECAHTISQMAFTVEREVTRIYDETGAEGPGIWEYEVGEELGRWLYARALVNMVPDNTVLEAETRNQTLKFLNLWEGE